MKHLLIFFCLFCPVLTLMGQENSANVPLVNVRGTVYENETLDPLEGAQVRLTDANGKLVKGNATLKNGQYLLAGVPSATYTMVISYVGFKTQKFSLTLPRKSGNFKVSDVMMREDATMLAATTVEGKMPEMMVVDDTVMYNADAYKLPDGALVEELVKRLPGIELDDNGGYTWNGKPVSQILVDGKEFFGNNQNMVLKNLPAEIVDRVKAYEKKSDMARITGIDDGNERTVLDLSIKKNRKRGWFGNVDGAYGTHDRYSGRGMLNRFKGDQKFSVVGNGNNTEGNGMTDRQSVGATMNWQNKVIELNGSANGSFSQSSGGQERNSQSFENRSAAFSNSKSNNSNRSNNFSFNYKVEWKPDSTWNILFRPEFSKGGNKSNSGSESASFTSDPYHFTVNPLADYALLADTIGVNHRLNANKNSGHNLNASASLQVNKRLKKPGRNVTISANGGYSRSTSQSESYSQTDYYQKLILEQSLTGRDSVYHKVQYNDSPQNNHNMGGRLSYSEPIAFQTYLQLSYNYSYRFSDRDRNVSSIFDWMDDGLGGLYNPYATLGIDNLNYRQWTDIAARDIAQCNYTTNTYQNHDLRVQIRLNRTLYQLTVGGNVQPQINKADYTKGFKHYDVKQSVVNASPTLNFRYKFSRQEQLDIKYNGNTGQPGITDLIPDTVSNADPLNIRLGNPNLKPSFTHNMSVDYRRSVPDKVRSSNFNAQFRTTQNSTTNRTEYNDLTGGRISKPVNISGNWNGSTSFNFNTALDGNHYWRFNTNTQGSVTNAVGYVYQSRTQETVKNRTRGMHANERVRLTYRRDWKETNWSVDASVNGNIRYNYSRSTNITASNLDTYNFSYGFSGTLQMPWGMTFSTDVSEQSRRGYSDASMNTNQLIWNATLSQRLLKHKNLTLSLRAIDILNQRDDVSRSVSATSRTDSRSEMVNSYVLFSVNYRFGKFGGRNGGQRRGEQRVDTERQNDELKEASERRGENEGRQNVERRNMEQRGGGAPRGMERGGGQRRPMAME